MSGLSKKKPVELGRKYNFIDLFAGCGGLSEGFYAQGFNALAHVEIDHFACETLKTRMKYYGYDDADTAVLEEDITLKDILAKIKKVVGKQPVDIIIGGPPCQSFSPLGKAKDENNMQDDPRNYLFENYVKVLNHFKPKFFVFENVTGLLDTEVKGKSIFKMILRRLRSNYRVLSDEDTIVLNATNYGVPQERKRVILIGVRKDIDIAAEDVYKAIEKTHYLPGAPSDAKKGLKKYVTVKDANSITHKYMAEKIYGDPSHKVRIPSNLSIVGTMNTSDQNVFTLDTAFQSRWRMRLIENNFDNVRASLANAQILDTEVTWKTFCEKINAIIVGNKAKMASAEDKRLGVYFVHENDVTFDQCAVPSEGYTSLLTEYNDLLRAEATGDMPEDKKQRLAIIREALMHNRMFPEKVIKYLWDDAFKFNPETLFDTENMESLEQVIRTFVYSMGRERFKIFKPTVRASLYPDSLA